MVGLDSEEEFEEVGSQGGNNRQNASPAPLNGLPDDRIPVVVISLCRDQYREGLKEKELDNIILKNRVSFSDVIDNPSLLEHPNIMFFADRVPISFEEATQRIVEMAKEVDRMNVVASTSSRVRFEPLDEA